MKRSFWYLVLSLLAFAAFLYIPNSVLAQGRQNRQQKVVTLAEDEVHDGDYFAYGDVVEISGIVNGDVYAAGGMVFVDGTINGDLIAAGGQVNMNGLVTENLRVAGGQVVLSGTVGRNATVVAGSVDALSGSEVVGNFVAGSGNARLAGKVGGDGNLAVGEFRLAPGASFGGNVNYMSDHDATIAEGATVGGEISRTASQMPKVDKREIAKAFAGFAIYVKLASFVSTFVLGFLVIRFYPNFVKNNIERIDKNFGRAFLYGFLWMILLPLIGILFAVTALGLPLAFMTLGIYAILLFLTRVFGILWLGSKALKYVRKDDDPRYFLLVGVFVYYPLSMLPLIGFITKLVIALIGFGAFVLTYRSTWKSARKAKIV